MICPKCKKEVSDNVNLCPSCGAVLKEKQKVDENEKKENNNKALNSKGITSAIFAVLGILVIYGYRAWLGGLIYVFAASISIITLKDLYADFKENSLSGFIVKCFKSDNIGEKIMIFIALLLPIIVIISAYRWITVDTVRQVNDWFSMF